MACLSPIPLPRVCLSLGKLSSKSSRPPLVLGAGPLCKCSHVADHFTLVAHTCLVLCKGDDLQQLPIAHTRPAYTPSCKAGRLRLGIRPRRHRPSDIQLAALTQYRAFTGHSNSLAASAACARGCLEPVHKPIGSKTHSHSLDSASDLVASPLCNHCIPSVAILSPQVTLNLQDPGSYIHYHDNPLIPKITCPAARGAHTILCSTTSTTHMRGLRSLTAMQLHTQ